MRLIYTTFFSLLAIQLYAQLPADIFELEYEGEKAFATAQVDERYMGEYIQNKGKQLQQFFIKISSNESYLLAKEEEGDSWNLESRKELNWGLLCDKEGEPLVLKFQEFSDGSMHSYPAMIFVYKTSEEQGYASKTIILRNGMLFMDEAPKANAVATQ